MSERQSYYFAQSNAFKCGFHSYLDRNVYGYTFDENMSDEYKRGWKWAEINIR